MFVEHVAPFRSGRDVCSVMQHHSGRDSKGMETKLYVRGACFEEFDRIQSRNHVRLMCVMYLVSTFTWNRENSDDFWFLSIRSAKLA